jgi:hypothetical protein
LGAAVPVVPHWTMTTVPRAIPAEKIRQLLNSIDRSTAVGRRDYAIVLVLARLGLRASEMVFLELDDINWTAGITYQCGAGWVSSCRKRAKGCQTLSASWKPARLATSLANLRLTGHNNHGQSSQRNGLEGSVLFVVSPDIAAPPTRAQRFRRRACCPSVQSGHDLISIPMMRSVALLSAALDMPYRFERG